MLLYTASFQPGNSVVFLPLSKGLHHCPRDCVVVLWCFKWLGRDRITNHGSSIVSFSLAGKTSTVKGKLVSLCRFQEQMFHKLAFFELNFLFFPYTMCRLHTITCWTLGDYKQNEGFAWSIFVFFSLFFFFPTHTTNVARKKAMKIRVNQKTPWYLILAWTFFLTRLLC